MDDHESPSAASMLERAKTRYESSLHCNWYIPPPAKQKKRRGSTHQKRACSSSASTACQDLFHHNFPSDLPAPSRIFNQRRISGPHASAQKSATNGKKICKTKWVVSQTTSPFFPPPGERDFKTLDDCSATCSKKMKGMAINGVGKSGTDGVLNAEQSSSDLAVVIEPRRLKNGKTRKTDVSEEASVASISDKTRRGRSRFKVDPDALGQREISRKDWIPPVSVHALIQEELFKDPWKLLVACMLLNKTSGIQMRTVIWELFDLCPTPEAAVAVNTCDIEIVIRPLGLQRKRACMIQKFSHDYLGKDWSNVTELHGIGKYATDAYAIFCEGRWREVTPEDHKLVDYWQYLCATDGLGYAFKDERDLSMESKQAVSRHDCQ